MPGFDRTGPEGQGPRTGRQMGKCKPPSGNDTNGEINDREEFNRPRRARWFAGRGSGRGSGRGFRGGR